MTAEGPRLSLAPRSERTPDTESHMIIERHLLSHAPYPPGLA
ncbi:hypothetical protein [Actinomadura algeriensis]|uniref:Uncharacterized protein n=1 Tax=Actinomadura algeriensis TaxID=1679523 RepID=A0ABR9K5J3_9ACTN|nr:hypothetical protein [Actinomadura algeriensis]MBE1537899.1 hypothetical protein [Actinomadura algeriensis]